MSAIIQVERLSKLYRLGSIGARTLRDSVEEWLRSRRNGHKAEQQDEKSRRGPGASTFWALRDVSFEVQPGEVVGVVGRNGAGKSTLLKILSRITEPSEGRAVLRGRVAALLEVGTGFHPELTGRENIYLNGAILGMKRAEITAKFQAITEFAEIGEFIDTPVKRYSSGMSVRLAFAVAAHLEPEILIVDEVLAVGDAQFQKRCLGKMRDVASKDGRTVLFVSHNMQAVQSLCSSAVHIDAGRVAAHGPTQAVVAEYLSQGTSTTGEVTWPIESAPGDEHCRLTAVRVRAGDRPPGGVLPSREAVRVEMDFLAKTAHPGLCVGFDLTNADGITLLRSYQTDLPPEQTPPVQIGENRWVCEIPPSLLNGGLYFICPRVGIHNVSWIAQLDPVIEFEVLLDHAVSPFWNSLSGASRPGLVAPILQWRSR